ncbi:MAG: calcium/sodium antiporter [Gemmatimonadales bacterium]|nr:MAG: calcium/sodium antiporter [Gemmatimonadales bacterium]
MNEYLTNGLQLAAGVGVLFFGAEWLVRGAARLAASLGVSPIVVGLTVVSLGTSAPELVVSLTAALRGNSDLAMGNVMGSNLANIGLILGLTALIRPMKVSARVVTREVPIMLGVTALLYPLSWWDRELGQADGFVLVVVLGLYILFVNRVAGEEPSEVLGEYEEFARAEGQLGRKVTYRDIGLVVVGSLGLVGGGTLIVNSAEFLAEAMGVPDILVGLTVVAVGTSLPELATSMVAAVREEADIAVGNIVGSNIFNVAAILGTTSLVTPVQVAPEILVQELPAVLLLSLIVVPVTWNGFVVRRWEGAVLLTLYVVLGILLFTT